MAHQLISYADLPDKPSRFAQKIETAILEGKILPITIDGELEMYYPVSYGPTMGGFSVEFRRISNANGETVKVGGDS